MPVEYDSETVEDEASSDFEVEQADSEEDQEEDTTDPENPAAIVDATA
jgi:hypothetical protein